MVTMVTQEYKYTAKFIKNTILKTKRCFPLIFIIFVLIIYHLCLELDNYILRKPIGDISLDGLGQDWTLRRYILHLNDI